MQFAVQAKDLGRVLDQARKVIEKRTTIPILSHVLITTDQDKIRIAATDLDIMYEVTIPATVTMAGSVTTPGQTLFDIVKRTPPDNEIKFSVQTERLQVRSGRSRFTLPCLPPQEFPSLPPIDSNQKFEIEAEKLRDLWRVSFAMSDNDAMYHLNGLFFHTVEDKLLAAATDGTRLAVIECQLPDGAEGIHSHENPNGVTLPSKTVEHLANWIKAEEDGIFQIEASQTQIVFRTKNVRLASKLLDNRFPDYQRAIPKDLNKFLTINRKSLIAALDRVCIVDGPTGRGMRFTLASDKMEISMSSNENGASDEELEGTYEGESVSFGINGEFLIELLEAMDDDEISVGLTDPSHAIVVRGLKDNTLIETATFVQMPMRAPGNS